MLLKNLKRFYLIDFKNFTNKLSTKYRKYQKIKIAKEFEN